jgi:uncharacterized protein YqeY
LSGNYVEAGAASRERKKWFSFKNNGLAKSRGACFETALYICSRLHDYQQTGDAMTLRDDINTALKQAMRDRAADRLSTLRLVTAAIKDRDIAARGNGDEGSVGDDEVLGILSKMVKQRQESARTYEEGGRLDLAERELGEITVIEEFLPKKLDDGEIIAAIDAAIAEIGASSIRDMGKIMGVPKSKYTGQMDFGQVGPMVKDQLNKG